MPSCLTDERTPGVLPPATRGFSQPPVDPVVTHGYSKRHPKRFPGLLRRKAERGSWGTPVACFAPPDLTCLSRFPRSNYQRHFHRSEHWYVMSGEAVVTKNGEDIRLKASQAVDLPAETWHRVCNPGPAHMVFIEVQTGDYFGEDDLLVDVLGQKRHALPSDRLSLFGFAWVSPAPQPATEIHVPCASPRWLRPGRSRPGNLLRPAVPCRARDSGLPP